MAGPTVDIGTGTTVGFDSSFNATAGVTVYDVLSISWSGITRPEIQTTHINSTASPGTFGTHTWIPGDITDPGEITIEGHFNPDITPPIEVAAGNMTITFAGGGVWVAPVICTSFEATIPMEDKMGFTATFKVSAGTNITAG